MESIIRKIRGDGFEKMHDYIDANNFAIKKVSAHGSRKAGCVYAYARTDARTQATTDQS